MTECLQKHCFSPLCTVGQHVVIGVNSTFPKTFTFDFLLKFTCILTQYSKNYQISKHFDSFFDIWKFKKVSKIDDLRIFQTNLTNARFCYNEMAKIGDFCIFCPTNPHIAWKYSHFPGFDGKSGSKMSQNGKFSEKKGFFSSKIWHSIQNISKTGEGLILNHICFRNLDNFVLRRHWVIFEPLSGFPKNYHWIMC